VTKAKDSWPAPDATDATDESAVPYDDVHRGQVRLAYRLADEYDAKLMHVNGIGWHAYNGHQWQEDQRGLATRAVIDVMRQALADSLDDRGLDKDVRKCESANGMRGILDIAAALEPFAAIAADLDADPYLLNTANGTLDLRSLELRPHSPADRITKQTRAAFTDTGSGNEWQTFLTEILPDKSVRGFLQRLIGSSLLGEVREHVLPILTGTGANGKSVLISTLSFALGDYASTAEPDLFMHRDNAHPTGLMDLMGRRLVSVSETDRDRRLAEATMKRLVGGDAIKARRMRQDFVEFDPSHTLLLVTNHLPKVRGDDPAIWRRICVIPFDVVIPEAQRNPMLSQQLQLQADAILAWAVQGWRDYQSQGLNIPEAVKVATDAYQRDSDAVARFIDECCLINPHMHATTSALHERYCSWSQQDGAEPMSLKALGQAIDRAGLPAMKVNGQRIRRGIGLQSSDSRADKW
jgi:putative DNA primase/helicase